MGALVAGTRNTIDFVHTGLDSFRDLTIIDSVVISVRIGLRAFFVVPSTAKTN